VFFFFLMKLNLHCHSNAKEARGNRATLANTKQKHQTGEKHVACRGVRGVRGLGHGNLSVASSHRSGLISGLLGLWGLEDGGISALGEDYTGANEFHDEPFAGAAEGLDTT